MSTIKVTNIQSPDSGTNDIIIDASGNVTVDPLYVDATNNRVGIGTTSVSAGLHVVTDVNPVLKLDRGTANNTNANFYYNGTLTGQLTAANADFQLSAAGATTPMSFYVNGSQRAAIDTSGRLLVGTSSTSASTRAVLQGNSSSSTGPASLFISAGTSTPSSGASIGLLRFSDSNHAQSAEITAFRDGGTWTSGSSQPTGLVFSTTADSASSPTERMRIEEGGTSRFTGIIRPSADNVYNCGASSNRWAIGYFAGGTTTSSDQRLKTNISNCALGADFIKSLRPVSYKFIEGGKLELKDRDENGNIKYESRPGIRTHWGFLAQEVKDVVDAAGVDFGGWMLADKNDPNSSQFLRYEQFIAPLTKALQEALEKIETLEAKVADLEAS